MIYPHDLYKQQLFEKKKKLIQLLVMLIPYEKNTEVGDNE